MAVFRWAPRTPPRTANTIGSCAAGAVKEQHSSWENGKQSLPEAVDGRDVSAAKAKELASDPSLLEAKKLFEGARTLAAHKAVEALCAREGCTYDALAAHSAQLGLDLVQLQDLADLVRKVLEDLPNEEGFTCAVKSEPRVLHRKEHGSSIHTVKYFADVPAPLEHMFALCVEYDLISIWQANMMLETCVLHWQGNSETIYGAIWTPLLIYDAMITGTGHDLGEEHRCLMMTLRDAEEPLPPGALPVPPGHTKRKRGGCARGTAILLEALPPGPGGPVTRVHIVAKLDPRLPFVPGFLIAFLLKVVAPYIYRQVQQVLGLFKEEGSFLQQRFAQNASLYDRVRRRTAELLLSFYGPASNGTTASGLAA